MRRRRGRSMGVGWSSVVGRRRARDVGRGLACEDTDRHACPAGCDRWMVWVHIGCDVKV